MSKEIDKKKKKKKQKIGNAEGKELKKGVRENEFIYTKNEPLSIVIRI